MLIDNKNVRNLGASLQKSEKDPLRYLNIRPGINKVSEDDWATVKDTDFMKFYLKNQTVVIVDAKGDSLKGHSLDKALHIIERCANIGILKDWSRDALGEIREAIEAQIEKLKLPASA